MKSESFNFLEPSGPLQGCNGTALPDCVETVYELPLLLNNTGSETFLH